MSLERLVFTDGSTAPCQVLYCHAPTRQRSNLAAQLGCRFLDDGSVEVNEFGQTSRPGVFAVGDMARQAARSARPHVLAEQQACRDRDTGEPGQGDQQWAGLGGAGCEDGVGEDAVAAVAGQQVRPAAAPTSSASSPPATPSSASSAQSWPSSTTNGPKCAATSAWRSHTTPLDVTRGRSGRGWASHREIWHLIVFPSPHWRAPGSLLERPWREWSPRGGAWITGRLRWTLVQQGAGAKDQGPWRRGTFVASAHAVAGVG
jgi:pyridine nucleotide-disulfide oxidoreductase